jgi:hypothetical protein
VNYLGENNKDVRFKMPRPKSIANRNRRKTNLLLRGLSCITFSFTVVKCALKARLRHREEYFLNKDLLCLEYEGELFVLYS